MPLFGPGRSAQRAIDILRELVGTAVAPLDWGDPGDGGDSTYDDKLMRAAENSHILSYLMLNYTESSRAGRITQAFALHHKRANDAFGNIDQHFKLDWNDPAASLYLEIIKDPADAVFNDRGLTRRSTKVQKLLPATSLLLG